MKTSNTTASLLSVLGIGVCIFAVFATLIFVDQSKYAHGDGFESDLTLIASRDIYDYQEDVLNGIVTYAYFGDLLPEKLYDNELPEKRTGTMVVRKIRDIDKDHRELQALFSVYEVRARDGLGRWRELLRATTTSEIWEKRPIAMTEHIRTFFLPTAKAFTAAAGAGYTFKFATSPIGGCGPVVGVAKTAPADTVLLGSGRSLLSIQDNLGATGCDAQYAITFLPFNTGVIPNTFPITSASISITITDATDILGNGNVFRLATSSQASHAGLATTDHASYCPAGPSCNINTVATDLVAFDSGGPTSFGHTFDIEVADLAAVIRRNGESSSCSATNGITCLVVRPPSTLAPGDGNADTNDIIFDTGSVTLSSNYVESNFAFWQFQDF